MNTNVPSNDDDNANRIVAFPQPSAPEPEQSGAVQSEAEPQPEPEESIFAPDELDEVTPPSREDYLTPVKPWPSPVNGADLLTDLASFFIDIAIAEPGVPEVLALWVATTWALHPCRFPYAPRLIVKSPPEIHASGKSTVMKVLLYLVRRPIGNSGITESTFFRYIDECQPTMVLDECDTYLPTKGFKGLTKTLNSGFDRLLATEPRNEYDQVAKRFRPISFSTFAMVALGGIGDFAAPQTASRAFTVLMQPKMPDQRVEKFEPEDCPEQRDKLRAYRAKMMRFVLDNRRALRECRPSLPREIANNRLADLSAMLLRMADVADGEWPMRARNAVTQVALRHQPITDSRLVLTHIADLLADPHVRVGDPPMRLGNFLYSEHLVEALRRREDWPYERLTKHRLRHRLAPLGIPAPEQEGGNSRIGKPNWRGYRREWFETAFLRHRIATPCAAAREPLKPWPPATATPTPAVATAEPLDTQPDEPTEATVVPSIEPTVGPDANRKESERGAAAGGRPPA